MAHRDARLITLVSSRGAVPHRADINETALNTVLRCAVITVVPPQNVRWLTLPGTGSDAACGSEV